MQKCKMQSRKKTHSIQPTIQQFYFYLKAAARYATWAAGVLGSNPTFRSFQLVRCASACRRCHCLRGWSRSVESFEWLARVRTGHGILKGHGLHTTGANADGEA